MNWQAAARDLTPFIYGTLGACVFLLRSLHEFMHERTYDRRYKPEYMNRILLGTISGGIVSLLISQGPPAGAQLVSAAAIGFVAGYNTDLLFTAIERITNAILPKVPPTPVQVQATPGGQAQGGGSGPSIPQGGGLGTSTASGAAGTQTAGAGTVSTGHLTTSTADTGTITAAVGTDSTGAAAPATSEESADGGSGVVPTPAPKAKTDA